MALDAATLELTARELKTVLADAKIAKLFEPTRDELVITLRTRTDTYALLLSARSGSARVCLTEETFENPETPPSFCMLMRKHLTGGKLLDVHMEPGDRIVYFDFQCTNEMGDLVRNTLCAELMGRYSNLVLVQNGKIIDALEGGAKGSITVAVACGVAGIISGCITVTGLASKLLSTIVSLSGGHMIIALALTMLCCIVLGMGVPTTANYCIMAATCAPILMDPSIGVTKMAAHFFVFYFGIVADITPPVALAAYAGSAIAKADPMKTGFNATKLAIAAFIVPYIFAFSPQMLFVDVTGAFQVVQICISALLGIFGVAAALNGFLYRPIPALLRVAMAVGGLGMMIPGTATDIAGFVLVVGIVLYQRFSARRAAMV